VIGRRFERDHTTVIAACRRAAQRISADPEAFATVRALTDALHRSGPDAV
jgi:chromosomal replication initiation ATPase DnaA